MQSGVIKRCHLVVSICIHGCHGRQRKLKKNEIRKPFACGSMTQKMNLYSILEAVFLATDINFVFVIWIKIYEVGKTECINILTV